MLVVMMSKFSAPALLAAILLLPIPAGADRFGGLVGFAPPPVKCKPATCPFVDGDGTEQRTMANSSFDEVKIRPHVVRIGETFDLVYKNTNNPDATNTCNNAIAFATLVGTAGAGSGIVTCTFRATGATSFQDPDLPGSPVGPGYIIKDTYSSTGDSDYYAIVQNLFELAGKVLRGDDPPPGPVPLVIEGGSPSNRRVVETNTKGEYSAVLPPGSYTVTPQGVSAEPAMRAVDLSNHRRRVDFALSAEHVVNQAEDASDHALGDGLCDVDADQEGLQCTIRAAIEEVNAGQGDRITFDVPGTPDLVITVGPLPALGRPVVIDGTTQPGDRPAIVRGGDFQTDLGKSIMRRGLAIQGDGSFVLRRLNVRGFGDQIVVNAPGASVALSAMVLGTDRTGNAAAPEQVGGFASVCNEGLAFVVAGERVFGAGVRATAAAELMIEGSAISRNPGCGIDLGAGVVATHISDLRASHTSDNLSLGGQGLDVGGAASDVVIENGNVATITGAVDATRWRITGTTAVALVLRGDDHVIGVPGAGNTFESLLLSGSRNTVQGNTIQNISVQPLTGFAVEVKGGQNQIGGAAEGEGNLIEGGGGPNPAKLSDVVADADGVIQSVFDIGIHDGTGALGLSWGGLLVACPDRPVPVDCHRSTTPPGSEGGQGNVIQGNTFRYPKGLGGVVIRAPGTVVRGNKISRSDFAGIFVDGQGAIVEENQVTGVHLGPGIYVHSGDKHRIVGNFLDNNRGPGIDLGRGDFKLRLFGDVPPNDPGDLDEGPNRLQNHPEVTLARLRPDGALRLKATSPLGPTAVLPLFQFFGVQDCASALGKAQGLVAEIEPVDGAADINLVVPNPTVGRFGPLRPGMGIVATVTSVIAGTSELSPCVTVLGRGNIDVKLDGIGNDVYGLSAEGQEVRKDLAPGDGARFRIDIENDGEVTTDVAVAGEDAMDPFTTRYLEATSGADVTAEVLAGTYTIHDLAPGQSFRLQARVRAAADAPASRLRHIYVAATPASTALGGDAVEPAVRVVLPPP